MGEVVEMIRSNVVELKMLGYDEVKRLDYRIESTIDES